jgi:hypothetical protein
VLTKLKFHCICQSGPVVIGFTLVLAVVTATPFKVSFVITSNCGNTIAAEARVIDGSFILLHCFTTTAGFLCSIQFAGVTLTSLLNCFRAIDK